MFRSFSFDPFHRRSTSFWFSHLRTLGWQEHEVRITTHTVRDTTLVALGGRRVAGDDRVVHRLRDGPSGDQGLVKPHADVARRFVIERTRECPNRPPRTDRTTAQSTDAPTACTLTSSATRLTSSFCDRMRIVSVTGETFRARARSFAFFAAARAIRGGGASMDFDFDAGRATGGGAGAMSSSSFVHVGSFAYAERPDPQNNTQRPSRT